MNYAIKKTSTIDANATYRSGAAARLSGVPVETLRVWERRYGITDPTRSERGQRQYSFEDVRRLGLIKQLVDAGNSIGAVAHLELNELLAMLSEVANLPSAPSSIAAGNEVMRIALVGVMLRQSLLHRASELNNLNIIQTSTNLQQAPMQFSHAQVNTQINGLVDAQVDVLIVEQGELTADEEQIPLLKSAQQACQASAVLILYRFASSDAIRQLRLAGFHVARIPADMLEIEHLCRVAIARAVTLAEQHARMEGAKKSRVKANATLGKHSKTIPERLLDDDNLMHIAKSATSIHCECPRHLVDLLQMLTSFERYSAQCENRNEQDASLHRDLHYTAAHARSALEQALVRVAQAEGITY